MSPRVYPSGPIGPTPLLRAVAGGRVLAVVSSYDKLDELLGIAARIVHALRLDGRVAVTVERRVGERWVEMPMLRSLVAAPRPGP